MHECKTLAYLSVKRLTVTSVKHQDRRQLNKKTRKKWQNNCNNLQQNVKAETVYILMLSLGCIHLFWFCLFHLHKTFRIRLNNSFKAQFAFSHNSTWFADTCWCIHKKGIKCNAPALILSHLKLCLLSACSIFSAAKF